MLEPESLLNQDHRMAWNSVSPVYVLLSINLLKVMKMKIHSDI